MTTHSLSCPACGFSKEIPVERLPESAQNVRCPSCDHRFLFTPGAENNFGDFQFETGPVPPPQRSVFVNVLAWICIGGAGFMTLISLLQNVMIFFVFPRDEMKKAMQSKEAEQMPELFRFAFSHIELYFLFFLVVCIVVLVSAIALLKRKNWARLVFITLLGLGIFWNIVGVVMQFFMVESMQEFAGGKAPPEMATIMTVVQIISVLMAIGVSILLGWLIKKLTSAPIKAEFL